MKRLTNYKKLLILAAVGGLILNQGCKKTEHAGEDELYEQADQMARPAINTVFNNPDQKDAFNLTVPEQMGAKYAVLFRNKLLALNAGYSTNLLGLDATSFAGVLATDVLNVSTTGKTTFYDGKNVLTGRMLSDDVIDVELTLVFGGPGGTSNPGLISDHVDHNDKAFSNTFPYLAPPW